MHSREAVEQGLKTLDFLEDQIESAEKQLEAIMKVSAEADLLKTLPCVGKILSMVLMLEIGRVDRFPTAAYLASYAGQVPRGGLSSASVARSVSGNRSLCNGSRKKGLIVAALSDMSDIGLESCGPIRIGRYI